MSNYDTNQRIVYALVDRKVMPLGARAQVIRASERRAWMAVCRGDRAATAIRNAVSWAADMTDQLASGQREDRS